MTELREQGPLQASWEVGSSLKKLTNERSRGLRWLKEFHRFEEIGRRSGVYPFILPVVIPTQVTLWERVEQPCKADKNRPFSVTEYRKLEELRRAGSFDALGFQYIWDRSCDFDGGLKVGQATQAEAADLSVIAELLNLTCIAKPAGGLVKIDEALRVAAQIKAGKASFEAVQMDFQGSCKLKE